MTTDPNYNSPVYGFTGEPTDDNGLLYLRARYLSPQFGNFLSLDPLESESERAMSLNGYSYTGGNPINWTDPSGEDFGITVVVAGGILLLIGAVALANSNNPAIQQAYQAVGAGISQFIQNVRYGISNTVAAAGTTLSQSIQIVGYYYFGISPISIDVPNATVLPFPLTPPPLGPTLTSPCTPTPGITLIPFPGTPMPPMPPLTSPSTPMPPIKIPGFPIPTPPAPGSTVLQSVRVPGADDLIGFTNRASGNPPGGLNYGIYDYWEWDFKTNSLKDPKVVYVGSARLQSLLTRLRQHRNPRDTHPLGSLDEAKYTVLTPKAGVDASGGILVAEEIRRSQLLNLGVPLSNMGDPANKERVRRFWERKGYEDFTNWPDWLYPPAQLLK